jgi:hypothetical protein
MIEMDINLSIYYIIYKPVSVLININIFVFGSSSNEFSNTFSKGNENIRKRI